MSTPNATITVRYGDQSVTFELEGLELSRTVLERDRSTTVVRYLSDASRGWIADEVESALLRLDDGSSTPETVPDGTRT